MAPSRTSALVTADSAGALPLDPKQTLRASTALLKKIQSDDVDTKKDAAKQSLLEDADEEDAEDGVPVWLVLTTKKHIVDKKRLKPGKIVLPHPSLNITDDSLRICLITADPQRMYKDLIADDSFPLDISKRIHRVIGISKLKAKYKSFETRRQLFGEYDVFMADDRVITYLPQLLGKTFYKSGSKRPIPVSLEGKRQSVDEQGNKRRKLAEGGSKVVKSEVKPTDVAHEIQRTLGSALVHLAPSTTTAIKVGTATMEPSQLQDNIEAVVAGLVDRYVPQKWNNVRSIHIKGPNTAALPIWLTAELWEDENDVLEEAPAPKETKKDKKRKRALLAAEAAPDVIEVPGPDGEMRRLEKPTTRSAVQAGKKQKTEGATDGQAQAQAEEKVQKEARKAALKKQKEAAKAAVNGSDVPKRTDKKTRMKAADLL